MMQQYVTFLFPGSFMPEEKLVKINSRSDKFEIPNNCFAYYFSERQELESDGEILRGKMGNKSGRFYFGKAMTAEEVKSTVPDSSILLSNMENNNWNTVVKTRQGNFQPLMEDDVIVSD